MVQLVIEVRFGMWPVAILCDSDTIRSTVDNGEDLVLFECTSV